VADDLDVLRGFLEAYGMQVDCAASGQEAIARIRAATVNYNAIFMDHMMPGMDGIETTRVIREEIGTDYARMVPIIALTANALAGYEKIFSSQGFQEYLTKPVDSGQVDTVIRHWVRNRTWTPGKPRKTGHRIAGIDWNKGLARFGGDEERYRAALESYVANTAHFLDKIRDVHAEMLSEYSAIVHDIKENSYAIEAHLIGEQAETLEHAARDGKFDFVSQGNPTFILLLENLLADITVDVADTLSDAPDPLA
jgi:CheY-like chemotaxis protein